jgi:23S rRNA (cytidine1920-2'-O)/16S rRNA (cytidine1409-2'-O)-methyltransferase
MARQRLDQALVSRGLVPSRSQAESYIKLGEVQIDGKIITKAGHIVEDLSQIRLTVEARYVSRACLKLASVADKLKLDFQDVVVLDVGSSTGGFTDYALLHGARKAIAVEVGSQQMHPKLRHDPRIELHEQTDIRDISRLSQTPDIVLIDVSFISLQDILPAVARLISNRTKIVAMVKPQFETKAGDLKHKGVIKNDKYRRAILKDFENWAHKSFLIVAKADSLVKGKQGNQERFYILRKA